MPLDNLDNAHHLRRSVGYAYAWLIADSYSGMPHARTDMLQQNNAGSCAVRAVRRRPIQLDAQQFRYRRMISPVDARMPVTSMDIQFVVVRISRACADRRSTRAMTRAG